MNKYSRIYIAGHTGLLGSALIKRLSQSGYNLLAPSRHDLNLLDRYSVERFFKATQPDYVFLAAAKVGNIVENIKHPVEFLEENLLIQQNVMRASYETSVKKLLFFSSNCCYPRECPQPMKEEYLMTGLLESTNQAYAMAKLAGIEMCRAFNIQYGTNFIVVIPASMYGENDHFDFGRAHLVPELLKTFYQAKLTDLSEVRIPRDGSLKREFIYVDDVANISIFLMENLGVSVKDKKENQLVINVGTGLITSFSELALIIADAVGYRGDIDWCGSGGMPEKILDSSRCREIGGVPVTNIYDGIRRTYNWCLQKDIFKKNR